LFSDLKTSQSRPGLDRRLDGIAMHQASEDAHYRKAIPTGKGHRGHSFQPNRAGEQPLSPILCARTVSLYPLVRDPCHHAPDDGSCSRSSSPLPWSS
jgi:hypothetical protein